MIYFPWTWAWVTYVRLGLTRLLFKICTRLGKKWGLKSKIGYRDISYCIISIKKLTYLGGPLSLVDRKFTNIFLFIVGFWALISQF